MVGRADTLRTLKARAHAVVAAVMRRCEAEMQEGGAQWLREKVQELQLLPSPGRSLSPCRSPSRPSQAETEIVPFERMALEWTAAAEADAAVDETPPPANENDAAAAAPPAAAPEAAS